MTDEKNPPENISPEQPPADAKPDVRPHGGGTTHDLRKHADQALRLLREAEDTDFIPKVPGKPSTEPPKPAAAQPSAITDEASPGNTTHDLAKAAQEAMELMQAQKRPLPVSNPSGRETMFTDDMVLRIEVLESTIPLVVDVRGEMTIGRGDTVTDYTPEIDLTKHDAYRLGLSRRHAILRRKEDFLELTDLGSRNGTHINGDRLDLNETRPVHDGDEITLGNLTLKLIYQKRR
jgi:hypothetical protein